MKKNLQLDIFLLVLLLQYIFKLQYIAGAGAGAGIMDKVEPEPNYFACKTALNLGLF